MIFGDMPDMSSWLHAKTSKFSLRNWMSLVLISGLSVVPILVVLVIPSSTSVTVSKASTLFSPFSSITYVWFSFAAKTAGWYSLAKI